MNTVGCIMLSVQHCSTIFFEQGRGEIGGPEEELCLLLVLLSSSVAIPFVIGR